MKRDSETAEHSDAQLPGWALRALREDPALAREVLALLHERLKRSAREQKSRR